MPASNVFMYWIFAILERSAKFQDFSLRTLFAKIQSNRFLTTCAVQFLMPLSMSYSIMRSVDYVELNSSLGWKNASLDSYKLHALFYIRLIS